MPFKTDVLPSARREISRRARDAFPPMGIYIIRDKEAGRVLVASSRNVYGAMNRIQFELRLRSHSNKTLQAEWNRSGPGRFDFEIVELLKEREDSNFDYAEELRMLEQIYREHYEQQAGATR
jgi:hypothetical protein